MGSAVHAPTQARGHGCLSGMIKTTVSGVEAVKAELEKLLSSLDVPVVTVGIHEGAQDPPDGEINMASLGAVHEFGANINHPGGTAYGYATKADAVKGKSQFLAKGAGYMVLGQTKPHNITIPERAWLVPGFESGLVEYSGIIEDELSTDAPNMLQALNRLGVIAVGKVQEYMTNLKAPANKPSTIRKKGSANPLIDEGLMRSSVTYTLQAQKPEEGL
jgi:hypothetical protein